jgi:hypothetical protein
MVATELVEVTRSDREYRNRRPASPRSEEVIRSAIDIGAASRIVTGVLTNVTRSDAWVRQSLLTVLESTTTAVLVTVATEPLILCTVLDDTAVSARL